VPWRVMRSGSEMRRGVIGEEGGGEAGVVGAPPWQSRTMLRAPQSWPARWMRSRRSWRGLRVGAVFRGVGVRRGTKIRVGDVVELGVRLRRRLQGGGRGTFGGVKEAGAGYEADLFGARGERPLRPRLKKSRSMTRVGPPRESS
jgi:hypothetical protein